jgi:tRNA1Val (adenine37-N6)-methyltransferase
MSDSSFHFKQFTIHQDKCAMKVGTDAVLLGAWVDPANASSILDIGTGTGVLALMMAQKSNSEVIGIDIDQASCEQAQENVLSSPWPSQIKIQHTSLQNFAEAEQEKFDLVVSNPPYFIDASKPASESRENARHTDNSLSFDALIEGIQHLLSPQGRFCLILPLKEGSLFKEKAESKGLHCTNLLRVKTKMGKVEKRLLMEFQKGKKTLIESEIIIQEEDAKYTPEYIEFTKDFYLGLKEYRHLEKE